MARVDVFIDGANFAIACRNYLGRYVNVKAFCRMLAKKCGHELGAIFYYDSPSPTEQVQRKKQVFWEAIRKDGIQLKVGRMEANPNGTHREKECDVMLAVDMVTRACDGTFDRALIVTGDTDQAYTAEVVKERGKEVGWAYFPLQGHVDRLKQVIPAANRIELTEKILRPIPR